MIDDKYTDYPRKVLENQIIAGLYIHQACQRFMDWTKREDIEFQQDKVEKVIKFVQRFKHYTGKHAGQPFLLSDFQVFAIANLYGWYYRGTSKRVINDFYMEMARKNGKSFFLASLCCYALFSEGQSAPEIELCANSAKQAGILFQMVKYLADQIDPKHRFTASYRDSIKFHPNKGLLQVLSSEASTQDGWNSSLYCIDEFHAATTTETLDVLRSAQGMRENPQGFIITTAGFNLSSPCYRMRQSAIDVLAGLKENDSLFALIYSLDEGDDWKDERNFKKANPNLDITITTDYLLKQIRDAESNSTLESGIRTKNFNQWLSSSDTWISDVYINKVSKEIQMEAFKGRETYIGIDLASVSDMTAVTFMAVNDDGKYLFKTFYFLPESALYEGANSEKYKRWKREKSLIVTPGNVCDYDYILNLILSHQRDFDLYIAGVFYDSYNSTQFVISSTESGLPMQPYSQSLGNFNRPTRELERLIRSEGCFIDNNEITRWMMLNVVLKSDYNNNVKPVKKGGGDKGNNSNKIDGAITMLEALGGWLSSPHYDNSLII